ncbi:MAG: signal peptide peptidase SppA [Salibacteraceae bacterium]
MKQFLKYFFASTLGTIVGFVMVILISGIVLAGIIGSAVMMAGKSGKDVKVKANSILVIDLTTGFRERTIPNPFENFEFDGFDMENGIELNDFVNALQVAAKDSSIDGIMIKGAYFNGGMATMQTVRDHLTTFKDSSDKFILAYEEAYTQGAYYVASVADELYMFHEGMIDFKGLSSQIAFFTGAMEKLGIDATILKGPDNIYKSAVEPFYRKDMSEPNKEQISRIIENLWNDMLVDLSEARSVSVDDLNSIADDMSIRKPEDAVGLKLIDGLAYYDEILSNLRGKLGIDEDDDIESISIEDYAKVANKKRRKKEDKSWELKDEIAVIYAIGAIGSGEGDEENIGSETTARVIREARLDEDIKAIVLRVNSPGGSALASDVIWRETVLAGEAKPFIVSFGDVAASGGYYISANAHRIFAMPNTITGSIGAFGLIPNVQSFMNDKLGITFDGVKTNKHADFGSLARSFDEAELDLLNGYLTQVYTEFVDKVAEGRGMSYEQVDSIGRGRVWTGGDALEIGLVDEIGGLQDAIEYAAQQAELEDYQIKELPEKDDPFEKFFKEMTGSSKAWVASWVLGDEAHLIKQIHEMRNMEGVQMRMLYDIKVR